MRFLSKMQGSGNAKQIRAHTTRLAKNQGAGDEKGFACQKRRKRRVREGAAAAQRVIPACCGDKPLRDLKAAREAFADFKIIKNIDKCGLFSATPIYYYAAEAFCNLADKRCKNEWGYRDYSFIYRERLEILRYAEQIYDGDIDDFKTNDDFTTRKYGVARRK